MQRFLFIGVLLLFFQSVNAQINNKIKTASEQNSANRTSSSSNSSGGNSNNSGNTNNGESNSTISSSSSSDDLNADLSGATLEGAFYLFKGIFWLVGKSFEFAFTPSVKSVDSIIYKDSSQELKIDSITKQSALVTVPNLAKPEIITVYKNNPDKSSLEALFTANTYDGSYFVWRPEFALTYFHWSPSLRANIIEDATAKGNDKIAFTDLQFLRFKVLNQNNTCLYLGYGRTFESWSGRHYPEFSMRLDFPISKKIRVKGEARLTVDTKTSLDIRREANAMISYQLLKKNTFEVMFGINAHAIKLYDQINLNTGGAGIWLRL